MGIFLTKSSLILKNTWQCPFDVLLLLLFAFVWDCSHWSSCPVEHLIWQSFCFLLFLKCKVWILHFFRYSTKTFFAISGRKRLLQSFGLFLGSLLSCLDYEYSYWLTWWTVFVGSQISAWASSRCFCSGHISGSELDAVLALLLWFGWDKTSFRFTVLSDANVLDRFLCFELWRLYYTSYDMLSLGINDMLMP